MLKNIIYLTDDYLFIGNTKTKEYKKIKVPKNILKNGKVINLNKFLEFMISTINKNNLNNSIFGNNIKIIVSSKYNNVDITIIKNIFTKLNFKKIIIIEENKYYNLKPNKAYLDIFNNYMLLTYIDDYKEIKEYILDYDYFLIDNLFNMDYLEQFIKNKINKRELYLLGYGKYLNDFYNTFEKKYHNITYLYSNHDTFIIDSVK